MSSNLKTPAEFNAKAENQNLLLKSPATLGQDNKKKIEWKTESIMKKPSDFSATTLHSKPVDSKKIVSKQVSLLFQEKRKCPENLLLSSSVSRNQLSQIDEEFYKESIRKLQRSISDKELEYKALDEKWKTKFKTKEDEVINVVKKLNETEMRYQTLSMEHNNKDSKYFIEVKSVYEKYINLQQQFDSEKNKLLFKIEQLESLNNALESENEKLKNALDESESKVGVLSCQIHRSQNDHAFFAQEQQKEKEEHIQKIEELNMANKELINDFDALKKNIEGLSNEVVLKNGQISQIKLELGTQKCLLSTKDSEVSSLIQENVDSCNDTKRLEEKLGNLCDELHCLKEKHHIEMTNYNYTQNELIKVTNIFTETKFELVSKTRDFLELEKTCQALQCSNKQLNLQSETLAEMLKLQDNVLNTSRTNQTANVLVLWRQKVYQLLVLLKSKDLDEF